ADVGASFRADVQRELAGRFDSIYLDSLSRLRDLKVESAAPALVRRTMEQLVAARGDRRELATYRGGAFRVRDLARWILAIDPRQARSIASASDDELRRFVRILTQRDLQLQQAESAGVQLTPAEWRRLKDADDSPLTMLTNLVVSLAQVLEA